MRYVSATDAKLKLDALLDAAQHEDIVFRRQEQDLAVLVSPQEYDRLRGLNAAEFERFCDMVGAQAAACGLTKDKLDEIL
jgi:hypothetical protein